jgi:hypothetical protein
VSGGDDWLREDLREFKGTLADLGRDVNAVLLRVVGVEHRLGAAESRLDALHKEIVNLRRQNAPTARAVTDPGATAPVGPVSPPPRFPPTPPSVLPLRAPRLSLMEALAASQVKLLARPVIGPIVGLFYLAAAAALMGALLGIPASQVRDWWGAPADVDDDDAVPSEDDVEVPPAARNPTPSLRPG